MPYTDLAFPALLRLELSVVSSLSRMVCTEQADSPLISLMILRADLPHDFLSCLRSLSNGLPKLAAQGAVLSLFERQCFPCQSPSSTYLLRRTPFSQLCRLEASLDARLTGCPKISAEFCVPGPSSQSSANSRWLDCKKESKNLKTNEKGRCNKL